jgi:multimeric flavodoxin WrbA
MAIRVLGILGSPRRGGSSELLLDESLAGARSEGAETEKLALNELDIAPCQGCDGCLQTGECTIHDGMDIVYPKLRAADAFILASPIYFSSLTAQTKLMVDRCQCLWVAKYILGRPVANRKRRGIFISIASQYSFEAAISVAKAFFTTLDISYDDELLFGGIDKKGEVFKYPTAFRKAFIAGVKLAYEQRG